MNLPPSTDTDRALPGGEQAQPKSGLDLRSQAFRGSAWMIGWRAVNRVLGTVNTLVLVRLLTPADFGIYAMAMLVVGLIEIFGESGQALALIRIGKPTREHFDTAWTTQVIFGFGLAACILASAPIAGRLFHSDAVEVLLYFLPLRALAYGFTNIGIVSFRIELDFAKEFRFGVYLRLIATVTTITCALLMRNYWALLIGVVMAKVIGTVLSYTMSSYRPRFCLSRIKEIWAFSPWMLIVYISEYAAGKVDQFVIGATSSPGIVGIYNVGADLATTPTVDTIQPVMRALFPVYSRLLDAPARLRSAVLVVLSSTATICLATGPGIASVAREFTLVLLGQQWTAATPLVFWFGIGAIPLGINYCIYTILSVTNHARLTAISIWVRIVLLVPALLYAAHLGGYVAVAETQAGVGLIVLGLDFFMLGRVVKLAVRDVIRCLYRPIIAMACMTLALSAMDLFVVFVPIVGLFLKITIGAVVYCTALVFVWWLVDRPDGIEAIAIGRIAGLLQLRRGEPKVR
jgi:lipopolysaccharide exporter